MLCRNCQHEIVETDVFCLSCGYEQTTRTNTILDNSSDSNQIEKSLSESSSRVVDDVFDELEEQEAQEVQMQREKYLVARRIAFYIDCSIFCASLFFAMYFSYVHTVISWDLISLFLYIIFTIFTLSYPFGKDFKGKSIGKRIMRISVVKYQSGLPSTRQQQYIRNIINCLCFFKEINQEMRNYGDVIANTIVVQDS